MQERELAKAFGRVLRAAREKRGFSQEQLALDCEIDRTYVSLLERGLRQPTITVIFRLAASLGIRPSALLAQVERASNRA
jgi:transcriptional regulator with XRE-family HTH domain